MYETCSFILTKILVGHQIQKFYSKTSLKGIKRPLTTVQVSKNKLTTIKEAILEFYCCHLNYF